MNKKNLKYYCKLCNKSIHPETALWGTGLCMSCCRIGKYNANYKYGKTLKEVFCKDCGKQLCKKAFYYGYKRCRSCAQKINNSGIKNGNYKDGRTNQIYYCIDCNKILTDRGRSIRCKSCAKKGELSPSWQGGLTKSGYYLFTNELKKEIRDRDAHICQKCKKTEKCLKRKLDVHHIDYNKENCNEYNLISLCSHCNLVANENRDFWFAYFTYLMENK